MGKHGFLTPKAIANRIKAKGLQKLRFYCQVCQKQCRDDNGFKCHIASESHQRQLLLVSSDVGKHIQGYSKEFLDDFIKLLSRRYGTRRILANQVYQEYISDRHHIHMNSTEWATLTEFVKYLGREGMCQVEETPKGWFIEWIDRRPETLAKQEAILRKERTMKDEDERERQLIEEQIERAKQQAQTDEAEPECSELKRPDPESKISLNIQFKAPQPLAKKTVGLGIGGLQKKSLSTLMKSSSSSTSSSSTKPAITNDRPNGTAASNAPKKSAVELLMEQDMARKKRLEERKEREKQGYSNGHLKGRDQDRSIHKDGDREKNRGSGRDRDRDRHFDDRERRRSRSPRRRE
ncbi:domain of Kin17 curved DNA-binding protein-domain-containing protein [Paraphysoderma sedebokerense]|nr:domain of Kin17 curved DNA-binding protein-domain-containing protein [Paraphysoderma sedebokerense]